MLSPLTDGEQGAIDLHAELWRTLSEEAPRIFDIGANRGQTAEAYRRKFPDAPIHAFEPNPALHQTLRDADDPQFTVHELAIGASNGAILFNITADDRTSSVLAADPGLAALSGGYGIVQTLEVGVRTLDDVVGEVGAPDILKIDTEGFELEVLKGAAATLGSGATAIVSCEVRFATAYQGQVQFHELAGHLASLGYRIHSFTRLEHTPRGYLYFGDATWISGPAWDQLGYL